MQQITPIVKVFDEGRAKTQSLELKFYTNNFFHISQIFSIHSIQNK